MHAEAPTRSTSNVSLSFMMMNIPVAIYSGTSKSGVSRSRYVNRNGEWHKVGNKNYDKQTGEEVEYGDIQSLVETKNGLVEITDEEIEALVDAPNGTLTIQGFVKQDALSGGHYIPQSLYQVRPQKRKVGKAKEVDPGAERAFALLTTAMRKAGVFAVVKYSLRGNPRFGALLSNGRLYELAFDNEVREDLPMPEAELSEQELSMMKQLIEQATQPEPPELLDDSTEKVMAYAEKKAESGEAVELPEAKTESTGDLMAALQASLEGSKS